MSHLTKKSKNKKVSDLENGVFVPVSTSSKANCSDECPFKNNGCYADGYPLNLHWVKVTSGEREQDNFIKQIDALPDGTFWRHNQAGDLEGLNNDIDFKALTKLVDANKGKKGFTYTHKPMDTAAKRKAIKKANDEGFTINLSANNLNHADELFDLDIAPIAVVMPLGHTGNTVTPKGKPVIQCPATREGDTTTSCASCQLCQKQRHFAVGFPAHGSGKTKANAVAVAA